MEENGLITRHIQDYRGRIPLKNISEFAEYFKHERFSKGNEISQYKQISALPSEFENKGVPNKTHERLSKGNEISQYKQISALLSEFENNGVPNKKYDPIMTFLHDEPFKYLNSRIQIVDIITAWGEEENLLDDFTIKNIL